MKYAATLAALAVAIAMPGPAGSEQPPTFRSGTDLVRLDIRAVDEAGRLVGDLRADEIEVIDDGQRRPVLFFQRMSDRERPIAEAARRTAGGEVSTNQGAPRGQLYLLVFDQGHIAPGNEQRARAAAARFLRTRVRPGDRVGLYAIPGPGPQIDFTANVMRVIDELPRVRGGLERFADGAVGAMRIQEAIEITRGNEQILLRVAERFAAQRTATDVLAPVGGLSAATGVGNEYAMMQMLVREDAKAMVARADQQARNFLLMFADVIRLLRPIEGRKNVILFSEGFFTDNVSRELEQVAAAAAESYTVIHAFDLNRRHVDLREQAPLGGDQYSEIQSRLNALGSLSAETDGTLILDASATLDAALTRVAEVSRDYYLVGFEPARAGNADAYRRVRVRVTRPGVRVYTRTGYSAELSPATVGRRRAIDTALRAPFPQQALPVRYTTYQLRGSSPGSQKVFLSLAADLPVATDAARHADVVFVVRNAHDGRVAASGTDTLPLPRRATSGSSTGTAHYKVQFELPAGVYLMRALVREPGGLTGTADRRFEVRRLDRHDVTFSDLILADERGALPVRATIRAGDGASGTIELYSQQPKQLEHVSVTVSLTPLGSERPVVTVGAELQELRMTDGGARRTAQIAAPLPGLPPGDYLVTALVRAGGEEIGSTTREARIAEQLPPPDVAALTERPEPADALDGRPAREYLAAIRNVAAGTALEPAAAYAEKLDWPRVIAALSSIPNDAGPTASALRGLAKLGTARYADAAVDLERAFEAEGGRDSRIAFVLGWARAGAGDDRGAIGAWRAAVFIDPQLVPAHLALAEAYLRLAQPDLALQVLRSGLAAVPDSPELQNRLAEVERLSTRRGE